MSHPVRNRVVAVALHAFVDELLEGDDRLEAFARRRAQGMRPCLDVA